MPYVGNIPAEKYASFEVQHFTTSATTSYTLTHAVSNELDLRLVLNNVVQQPGGSYAYTASATTLTLSSATTSSDTLYCVYIGKAVQTVTPPDGSVSESKLQVSNSPTNGYVLSAQSGASGGLTWAADAAGTVTGYTNGVDNRVITSSGTTTLNGETNFIYNGTLVGAGADGANADLGVGLHIKTSDTSASVGTDADELVIENNASGGSAGLSILSNTDGYGTIAFGDSGDNNIGQIFYEHSNDKMYFYTNASEKMRLQTHSDGNGGTLQLGSGGNSGQLTTGGGALQIWSKGTENMDFLTTDSETLRMRLNSTGNVQIGTTTNSGRISVVSAANEAMGYFSATKTSSYTNRVLGVYCAQTTTNSSYNLIEAANGDLSGKFRIIDSGNAENTNNSWGAYSDERIKQDITDANSQWNDIKALKVKNFKLKSNTDLTLLGVVAQDLETASMNGLVEESKPSKEDVAYHSDFGTIVSGTEDNGATPIKDEDGNITGYEDVFTEGEKVKSVKYSVLYMKAIKCLQEAITKIETLETANTNKDTKITALETSVADLTTRLEALENA